MTAKIYDINIKPKLGEGIYLVKDVSKILHLDYEKWAHSLNETTLLS